MSETTKPNVWDVAVAADREVKKESGAQPTLIFLGNKRAGKSSLINRFIDRHEESPPAVALEYMFGRRKGVKKVCDIWELGGGTIFTNLLDFVITSETLASISAVIVVDLSRPEEIMATVDTLIEHVRDKIDNILSTERHYLFKDRLRQSSKQRVGHQHEDVSDVTPCLIPLIIVGSKFDVYQGFQVEKRKAINRYLRLAAHMNGAALFYCSIRSEVTVNRIKGVLSCLTFAPQEPIPQSLDANRPLVIPFGSDSFQLIGTVSLEAARKEVTSLYPDQVVSKFVIPDNPAKDPKFKERDVDLIRDIRDQELEDYRRQLELTMHQND